MGHRRRTVGFDSGPLFLQKALALGYRHEFYDMEHNRNYSLNERKELLIIA